MRVPSAVRRVGAAIAIGYVLGTFPTADLVARDRRGSVDLRRSGSGNPGGATPSMCSGPGRRAVLAGDIAKGAAACVVGGAVAGPIGAHSAGPPRWPGTAIRSWNGFRGGKGVAASVGQCLATFPAYFPIDVAVTVATAANPAARQRAREATVVASAGWVLGGVVWWARGWGNLWGPRPSLALPLANLASSLMILKRFSDAG